MSKNAARKLIDRLPQLKVSLDKLTRQNVMVGVPQDKTRRQEEESPAGNATLAYIHDNGAPAANIPARPFMKPGVEAAKPTIVKQFQLAAKKALQKDDSAIERGLNMAGLAAQNAIRAAINEGPGPELSEGTLAARRRRGRQGTKPLVDTGQLRNSITYVIRSK